MCVCVVDERGRYRGREAVSLSLVGVHGGLVNVVSLDACTARRVEATTVELNGIAVPEDVALTRGELTVARLAVSWPSHGLRVLHHLVSLLVVHEPIGFHVLPVKDTPGTIASSWTGSCPRDGKSTCLEVANELVEARLVGKV